jgi:prophage maintenance system killer protein
VRAHTRARAERLRPPDAGHAEHAGEELERGLAAYERAKRASSGLDFDDLLHYAVIALESDDELRARCARRFAHVLVDEFQDVNPAQYRLAALLADGHRPLTVLGDPRQAICAYRGASSEENFAAFAVDPALAESALGRRRSPGEHERYPTTEEKIAVLVERLARNHPVRVDGNKRSAFTMGVLFAERNGRTWRPEDGDRDAAMVEALAAGRRHEVRRHRDPDGPVAPDPLVVGIGSDGKSIVVTEPTATTLVGFHLHVSC